MSSEPRTKQFEPHELMLFLDRVAAEMRAEQRAQLASLELVLPEVRPSNLHREPRSDGSDLASAPYERTVLDLEPPWHSEQRPSWLRPVLPSLLGRIKLRAALALAGVCVVLACLVDAIRMYSVAGSARDPVVRAPPPLPRVRLGREPKGNLEGEPPRGEQRSSERSTASAVATPQVQSGSSVAASAAQDEGNSRPREFSPKHGLHAPAETESSALPAAVSARSAGREPSSAASADRVPPRRAVDLLLSGRSREALEAYRALAERAPAVPAFAEAVRLLEAELQAELAACEDGPCAP